MRRLPIRTKENVSELYAKGQDLGLGPAPAAPSPLPSTEPGATLTPSRPTAGDGPVETNEYGEVINAPATAPPRVAELLQEISGWASDHLQSINAPDFSESYFAPTSPEEWEKKIKDLENIYEAMLNAFPERKAYGADTI